MELVILSNASLSEAGTCSDNSKSLKLCILISKNCNGYQSYTSLNLNYPDECKLEQERDN